LQAEVVGRDAVSDLRFGGAKSAATGRNLGRLNQAGGDWVLAIGNPFGLRHDLGHHLRHGAIFIPAYDDFSDRRLDQSRQPGGPMFNLAAR
jgi:serine protease Do